MVNLGYIYSYDRCENEYWDRTLRIINGDDDAYAWQCPHDEWAYQCFAYAAGCGDAEACYKLGDLLRWGRGCEKDEAAAFRWYREAYEKAKDEDGPWWGPAALRLGTCYEEGIGCEPDFELARMWYGIARAGLAAMVDAGDWYYKRSLKQAEDGLLRMEQELAE